MNTTHQYQNSVRFDRRLQRQIPFRWIAIALIGATFGGVWWYLPPTTAFWVLLPVTLVLAWLATYGWKTGLHAIHALVDKLEHLEG